MTCSIGVIVRNALTLMHKIKYFPNTVPNSIRSLFADNTLTYDSNHENSAVWLETYSSPVFRSSIFYKGPILAISKTNVVDITSAPSLFSLNIYKSSAKRVLLEQQSTTGEDENSWPTFLLYKLSGLRSSTRIQNQN